MRVRPHDGATVKYAPRVALLKQHNYTEWLGAGDRAGRIGPYGLEHLQAHGFELAWSDGAQSRLARARGVRRIRSAIERRTAFRGLTNALLSARAVHRSQLVLSLFEDQGTAAATLRAHGLRPYSKVRHVMVACWLAEDFPQMSSAERIGVRRALSSVDRIVVFSRNQVPLLADYLRLPPDRIVFCPFGIATSYFRDAAALSSNSIDLLAVGQDRSRDYATLCEALRGTDLQATVVCAPSSLTGIEPPANVRLLTGLAHLAYRQLLSDARVVVTPTSAPAYPSGQTVLLEAMAAGKANIITDSAAIRDYVDPDVTAVVVPPRDPAALRAAMQSLLRDEPRRKQIGEAAGEAARQRFDHASMWSHIAATLHDVLGASSDAPAP